MTSLLLLANLLQPTLLHTTRPCFMPGGLALTTTAAKARPTTTTSASARTTTWRAAAAATATAAAAATAAATAVAAATAIAAADATADAAAKAATAGAAADADASSTGLLRRCSLFGLNPLRGAALLYGWWRRRMIKARCTPVNLS